ncbi:MAG: nitrilase-related carbon-nitrogen hydrolase [Verrucomicrobiales bacterium]|nr:nitrilase-related carbon-nitrogen hydrolase [Verrucomicrobiales bacterium]
MIVVGLQTDIAWEDRQSNFSRIDELIGATDLAAGSLLVLPELSTAGFSMNTGAVAEARGGESEQFFASLAIRHRSHVIAGIASLNENPAFGANESVCFAPDGTEVARYRKRNPFPLANEADHYPAGNKAVVFEMNGWKVAPLICYDLRFPEPFREATALGAELFVVIANWPATRVDHWTTLLRARAIENLAYVVGVNRAGSDPHLSYPGASLIVDPKGEILAQAASEPCAFQTELDHDALLQWRRDFPALSCLNPKS